VIVKILLAAVYSVISFVAAIALGYGDRQLFLLIVLVFNQFLSSFLLYLRSNISGLQFYTTDSLLSVIDRFIMIVLCSLILWGNILHEPFKIEWFVYTQTISYLIAVIVVGIVLVSKTGKPVFAFNWPKTIQIIRQIAPFALLGLLMSVYNRTDSVLLERMLPDGKTQAGIYAQSYRILDAFSNFSLLFAALLLPMFSRLLATKEDFVPLLKTSFSLLFLMCISLSMSCFSFNQPIIKALYHDGDNYSASVFSILVLSFIPVSINYVFGSLLTANGSLKLLNLAAGFSVCLNITLNILLIKHYMALGAAIANLVTQSIMAFAQIMICFKIWRFKPDKLVFFKYLAFILLSISIIYVSQSMDGPWILRFLGAILAICFSSLITGILSVKELLKSYQAMG
jgi:O-antigen/teichoic acid export membrane protein